MPNVMVMGTFDLIHPGHLYFLNEAKKLGKLTVVVARDATVLHLKKRMPVFDEQTRAAHLKETKIPDTVVLGSIGNKYQIIADFKPDIICLGYDQVSFTENIEGRLLAMNLSPKIVRIKALNPQVYKSSKLRK